MANGKILETGFRNGLYKNLVEAGYDKQEAQRIVGVKYFSELKKDVCDKVSNVSEALLNDNFDVTLDCETINDEISELKKLTALLEGSVFVPKADTKDLKAQAEG